MAPFESPLDGFAMQVTYAALSFSGGSSSRLRSTVSTLAATSAYAASAPAAPRRSASAAASRRAAFTASASLCASTCSSSSGLVMRGTLTSFTAFFLAMAFFGGAAAGFFALVAAFGVARFCALARPFGDAFFFAAARRNSRISASEPAQSAADSHVASLSG